MQADMIQAREREILNGLRPKPDGGSRPFTDVLSEYFAWGRTQGGRRGLPWADEHAAKKERDLLFWRDFLVLNTINDSLGSLPKVESECRKLLTTGNSGKTVWNKVQNLCAMLRWCEKCNYLNENPLAALTKFDTEPMYTRRAITLDEFNRLLAACAPHRRLLYEVAACSGLRENELRMLEPKHLNVERNTLYRSSG